MMRLRNITGIPDSYQGVRHLISQSIPSDFVVIVCARIKSFLASCITQFFQMVNIELGRGLWSSNVFGAEKPQSLETPAWFKTNSAAPKTTVLVNEFWHQDAYGWIG